MIAERLNIASKICHRHPDAVSRIALSDVKEAGINTYTFGGLDFLSDKFATALSESGISQGQSVAVLLPPSAALAIAHLGALKTGSVVVPLSMTSDKALLEYALADSGASALVVDESMSGVVGTLARKAPNLKSCFVARDLRPPATNSVFKDFWSEVDRSSSDFDAVELDTEATAFILYLESQGEMSGVVHSHRSVIGQFCAFEMFNNVDDESVFWTAGDWCSASDVLGVLYPVWWYGCSLVAATPRDAAGVTRLIERCEVTHAFIASGQLEALAEAEPQPREALGLKPQTVVTEVLEIPDYLMNRIPGRTLNKVYGRPETGWIFRTCERLFATAPGSVGRPVPGRSIEIIDKNGNALPPGHAGHIAVHKSDPALFTEYRGAATRTVDSFIGEWFITGAVGYKNEDGDLYLTPSPKVGGAN